jgi:hypothetical protein
MWETKHEQALQQIKATITQDTMLTYPQFDMPFQIYTDASRCHDARSKTIRLFQEKDK